MRIYSFLGFGPSCLVFIEHAEGKVGGPFKKKVLLEVVHVIGSGIGQSGSQFLFY